MTCIIGFTDKENGVTYLACDSYASNGSTGETVLQKKVFKLKDMTNVILGFSGSIRDLNLLQNAENLIDARDESIINEKYIVNKFIPNIIRLFSNNGRNIVDKGINESNSYFLLAYKERLWKIHFDYSVMEIDKNYQSVGSGTYFALGSLKTTENMDLTAIERMRLALQSASEFSLGVSAPYYILNTKDDKVIEFKD